MGAGGVIIILKNVKSAMQVGLNQSGSVKLWHGLSLTHIAAFAAGWFF